MTPVLTLIDLDVAWDFTDSDTLSAGYGWKKFTYSSDAKRRDGTVCALYPSECAGGILGPQGSAATSDAYTYPGKVGPGSNTDMGSAEYSSTGRTISIITTIH